MRSLRSLLCVSRLGLCLVAAIASARLADAQDIYQAQANQAQAPAHVAFVDGLASLEREAQTDQAAAGTPLVPGDRLRTDNGRVEVLFPDGSALDVDEYLVGEDAVGRWLADCTEAQPGGRTPVGAAYANYVRWAERTREYVLSNKRLTQQLEARGHAAGKSGERYYGGFRLKLSDDEDNYVPESARWTPPDR